MSLRLRSVVIDVPADVYDATVAFWAAVLGAGTRQVTEDQTHLVEPDSVCGVHVRRRDEDAASVRLELESTEVAADLARVLAAGGVHLGTRPSDGAEMITSPTGLHASIVPAGLVVPVLAEAGANTSRLTAVFADVPAPDLDAEVAFWEAAFATGSTVSTYRDEYVRLDEVHAPGGRVDFEVQRVDDTPRIHLDVATTDVEGETARLEALGATRVAEVDTWFILRDPAGLLCCVVPIDFEEAS